MFHSASGQFQVSRSSPDGSSQIAKRKPRLSRQRSFRLHSPPSLFFKLPFSTLAALTPRPSLSTIPTPQCLSKAPPTPQTNTWSVLQHHGPFGTKLSLMPPLQRRSQCGSGSIDASGQHHSRSWRVVSQASYPLCRVFNVPHRMEHPPPPCCQAPETMSTS